MANSIEDLRLAVQRLRQTLKQPPKEEAPAPSVEKPAPSPPPLPEALAAKIDPSGAFHFTEAQSAAPAEDRPSPPAFDPQEQDSFTGEPLSLAPPAEGPLARLSWPALARACALAVAAAGGFLGNRWMLGIGLAALTLEAASRLLPRPEPSQGKDLEELSAQVSLLQSRVTSLKFSPANANAAKHLEEEHRELKRMVQSLYKILERPAPAKRGETVEDFDE